MIQPIKLSVIQHPDPLLHQASHPLEEITQFHLDFFKSMEKTLREEGGIGLAAPQVGLHRRMVIMCLGAKPDGIMLRLVNPVIVESFGGKQTNEEGCLSVPGITGMVERDMSVRVEALSHRGKPVKYTFHGLEAACVQHEIDHLDGVLFVQRMNPRAPEASPFPSP